MLQRKIWIVPLGIILVAAVMMIGFTGCSTDSDQPVAPAQQQDQLMTLGKDNPGIQRAMEVQDKFTSALMRNEDVVGTATGVTEDGTPAVIVLKNKGISHELPTVLEGVPVEQMVVGELVAYQVKPTKKGGNPGPPSGGGGGGTKIDPKGRFSRPVPIGVSTGNINECASGTIGCRVKNASNEYFLLSNNHVFARMNQATIGESMVQPGRYDVSCGVYPADVYANLSAYYPIVFSTSASNTMDAAIAATTTANAGNATPSNGYGRPNSVTVNPAMYMDVMKYGRTTGQTTGSIAAINATVTINYGSAGYAQFVDQFVVTARKSFSRAGDSGSLIVTNDNNANPVGLLFAGSSTTTIGSPINPILSYFGVTIDGK
jgi:hypothetical protein